MTTRAGSGTKGMPSMSNLHPPAEYPCRDIQWVASRRFLCQQPIGHNDPHKWHGEIHGRWVEITWAE
jgi:hypothetical protein